MANLIKVGDWLLCIRNADNIELFQKGQYYRVSAIDDEHESFLIENKGKSVRCGMFRVDKTSKYYSFTNKFDQKVLQVLYGK